jgi:hypothetical protein
LATALSEVDEIRRQMAMIRSELHHDMREVVAGASAAADWRAYVRQHPWIAAGLAFASGYMLVPRRRSGGSNGSLPVTSAPNPLHSRPQTPGRIHLLRGMLGLIGPVLLRAAQSYALNFIENRLINNPPGESPPPDPRAQEPTRRPDSDRWGHPINR